LVNIDLEDIVNKITTVDDITSTNEAIAAINDATTNAATTNAATNATNAAANAATTVGASSGLNDLGIGKALSEGSLQINASVELPVVTLVVEVDNEYLGSSGSVRHLDDLLLGGIRTLVQHVHDGLLLGHRPDHWPNYVVGIVRAHENVVYVHLWFGEVCGGNCSSNLGRHSVQEHVSGNLWCDAVAVSMAHLSARAAVVEADAVETLVPCSTAATTAAEANVPTAAEANISTAAEANVSARRDKTRVSASGDEARVSARGDEVIES